MKILSPVCVYYLWQLDALLHLRRNIFDLRKLKMYLLQIGELNLKKTRKEKQLSYNGLSLEVVFVV